MIETELNKLLTNINKYTNKLTSLETAQQKEIYKQYIQHYIESGEEKIDLIPQFTPTLDKQTDQEWEICRTFLKLHHVYNNIEDCKSYLNINPFPENLSYRNFRNVLDMFDYRIYEFRSKMLKLLNLINDNTIIENFKENIFKKYQCNYQNDFQKEIDNRIVLTHHGEANSISEEILLQMSYLYSKTQDMQYKTKYIELYERESNLLIRHIDTATSKLSEYMENIATLTNQYCDFLKN